MVDRLNSRPRLFEKNVTVNFLVDILRGSKAKRIIQSNWDKDPAYNTGQSHSNSELNRIIRKLILEKFLWEDLVVSAEGMTSAYVKKGPRFNQFGAGGAKFTINIEKSVKTSLSSVSVASSNSKEIVDDALVKLEEECIRELKRVLGKFMPEKTIYSAIPIEILREMSQKLPQTKEELLEIEQMTAFRYEKFGHLILDVCKDFSTKRMNHLEKKQMEENAAKQKERATFTNPVSNNPIYQADSQRRNTWSSG